MLLGGCLVGGGPTIGYGPRGAFIGAEASAGGAVVIPQVAVGVQEEIKYIRADFPVDLLAVVDPDSSRFRPVGRLGAGLAFPENPGSIGIFAIGAGVGHDLWAKSCSDGLRAAVSVELQVRYQRGWSVVLAPRLEGVYAACFRNDD